VVFFFLTSVFLSIWNFTILILQQVFLAQLIVLSGCLIDEKCMENFDSKMSRQETMWKDLALGRRIILRWIFREYVCVCVCMDGFNFVHCLVLEVGWVGVGGSLVLIRR
jgi:hypothetical protein